MLENDKEKKLNKNDNTVSISSWIKYNDLRINYKFFKKGILLVMPDSSDFIGDESKSFFIREREFCFFDLKKKNSAISVSPHASSIQRVKTLHSKLTHFAFSKLTKGEFIQDSNIVLLNKNRRGEVFLPFLFSIDGQQIGTYLYPWLSKHNENLIFSGFKQFVTAGCLFGSSLKGRYLDDDKAHILVKHDIKFSKGQKFHDIIYEKNSPSPYEQMLFSEFEKLASLIDLFSTINEPKRLLFHLPYYDYMLFGIELFIYGRITFKALTVFFEAIVDKKIEYEKKIKLICEKYNIEIRIISPFENLFGFLKINEIISTIFSILELSTDEVFPDIDLEKKRETEINLIKKCLYKLQNNSFNDEHREVWQNFKTNAPNTFKDLFNLANAVVLAVASRGKKNYETCSLLPLSEKQIQLQYEKTRSGQYPEIFYLTFLESLVTYSPIAKGSPFYFECCHQTLSDIITKNKLLQYSYQNVGVFARQKIPSMIQKKNIREFFMKGQIEQMNTEVSRAVFSQIQDAENLRAALTHAGYKNPLLVYSITDNNYDCIQTKYAIDLYPSEYEPLLNRFFENRICFSSDVSKGSLEYENSINLEQALYHESFTSMPSL